MLTKTVPMEWLWETAQEYRDWLKDSSFYGVGKCAMLWNTFSST